MFLKVSPLLPAFLQAAITDALSPDTVTSKVPAKTVPKAAEVKGSWLTIAAIGVGALLVGTLAMK